MARPMPPAAPVTTAILPPRPSQSLFILDLPIPAHETHRDGRGQGERVRRRSARAQQLRRLDGKIRQHAIGAGALEAEQAFQHGAVVSSQPLFTAAMIIAYSPLTW